MGATSSFLIKDVTVDELFSWIDDWNGIGNEHYVVIYSTWWVTIRQKETRERYRFELRNDLVLHFWTMRYHSNGLVDRRAEGYFTYLDVTEKRGSTRITAHRNLHAATRNYQIKLDRVKEELSDFLPDVLPDVVMEYNQSNLDLWKQPNNFI